MRVYDINSLIQLSARKQVTDAIFIYLKTFKDTNIHSLPVNETCAVQVRVSTHCKLWQQNKKSPSKIYSPQNIPSQADFLQEMCAKRAVVCCVGRFHREIIAVVSNNDNLRRVKCDRLSVRLIGCQAQTCLHEAATQWSQQEVFRKELHPCPSQQDMTAARCKHTRAHTRLTHFYYIILNSFNKTVAYSYPTCSVSNKKTLKQIKL